MNSRQELPFPEKSHFNIATLLFGIHYAYCTDNSNDDNKIDSNHFCHNNNIATTTTVTTNDDNIVNNAKTGLKSELKPQRRRPNTFLPILLCRANSIVRQRAEPLGYATDLRNCVHCERLSVSETFFLFYSIRCLS